MDGYYVVAVGERGEWKVVKRYIKNQVTIQEGGFFQKQSVSNLPCLMVSCVYFVTH